MKNYIKLTIVSIAFLSFASCGTTSTWTIKVDPQGGLDITPVSITPQK